MLGTLSLAGCFHFDHAFREAAALPADPRNPLNGAWRGYWQSFTSDANGPVWFVFKMTDADHVDIQLKTYGLGSNVLLWDMPGVIVHHPPTGLATMSYRSSAGDAPELTFDIAQRGDGMTVSFTFPDAVSFDGIMILRRTGPATQPLSAGEIPTTQRSTTAPAP